MIERCVSYASFIDTIALLLSHERFFILLLEFFTLMKLSPLEVDRELYKLYMKHDRYTGNWFPSPREVDRWLYKIFNRAKDGYTKPFSAPREVDKYLYKLL